jgi:hypothetical protein
MAMSDASGERVYEDGDQGDEPIAEYDCTAVDDDHDEADETDTGVHPKGLRSARTLVRCRLGRVALLGWGLWCEPSTTVVARDSAQSAAYRQGITDACVAESGEVVGGLIPITRETPGLIWSDQDELLVVAWKNPNSYKNELADRNETGLDTNKLLWVTPAPQVQHYCQAAIRADTELGQDGLALRLTQFLGLPPYRHYGLFIELWVKPSDLFRACADPETSDDRCELVPGPIPATVTNIANYPVFYEGLRQISCEGPYPRPWTGLGYTYHWGNATTEVGASELVLAPGAHYRIARISDTRDYCSPPD